VHGDVGPFVERDESCRLVVAEDEHQGRLPGVACGIVKHGAQRIVDREAVLLAHPVAVAPDDLGRVAGSGHLVEDGPVAESVPVEQLRHRHPGRVRRHERHLREEQPVLRTCPEQPVEGGERELVGHRHPVEGLAPA
jgi:hypothetical protein